MDLTEGFHWETDGTLTLDGTLLEETGLRAASFGDPSDPGLVLRI